MTRTKWTALLAATLATGAVAGLAEGSGGDRPSDDVCVKLELGDRSSDDPMAKIKVKNRGRNNQTGVLVELRARTGSGDVLSSWTVDLRARRTWSARLRVSPPEGTTVLVATATLDGVADQNPDDNMAIVDLVPAGGNAGAAVGAAIYAANCATCHGAVAEGTAAGPAIAGEDSDEVSEAVREGEDEMPAFPGLSASDIRALVAFLKDPAAAPPPPPPPPPGTAPTYTGNIKALLDAHCKACHTGKSAAMGLRFDTYAASAANAASGLAAVQASRMPKAGPLTVAEVQLFADWITGGKKQ